MAGRGNTTGIGGGGAAITIWRREMSIRGCGRGRTRALAVAAVLTAGVVVGSGPAGAGAPRTCPALDGRFDVTDAGGGWSGGTVAPGVSIDSASEDTVVFSVQEGFSLKSICVKAGSSFDRYTIDHAPPFDGPQTATVSRLPKGAGLSQISFDTAVIPTCEPFTPADVSFTSPVTIDANRAGGEPVSVVGQDGSISVSAHAGTTHVYKDPAAIPGVGDFAVGYFNQTLNWRSTDGGATWKYVGFEGLEVGPHSATSSGFSDPDYAMDQAGNIYNVEIDLANDAVFKSTDDGQSYPIANPEAWAGDRPWLTALEPDEVFLYVNLPKAMRVSRDPLLAQWTSLPTPPITSKAMPDPLNPDDGLIGPVGVGRFAISGDDAQTWTTHRFGPLGPAQQFFGVVAVDRAGNVYQAAASGYDGPGDTTPNGQVTFTYYERATGKTNTEKISVPIPSGDALWPWVVAGDDGRVAIVWYQNLAGSPRSFYAFAAVTNNAHGTTLNCSDGSTKEVPPQFDVENASGRPLHIGDICLAGTTCNVAQTFEGGDRRLGDFFTVNYDLDGNVIIASADTTQPNPLGGPKPIGNPVFMRQASGDGLLEEPIPARETRCASYDVSC
jgi:hypothetical protein